MTGVQLLELAIARIDSKSIQAWARVPQNYEIFLDACNIWLSKPESAKLSEEENVARHSAWFVSIAIRL